MIAELFQPQKLRFPCLHTTLTVSIQQDFQSFTLTLSHVRQLEEVQFELLRFHKDEPCYEQVVLVVAQ